MADITREQFFIYQKDFGAIDSNKSGLLDADEFHALVKLQAGGEVDEDTMTQLMCTW